MGRRYVIAFVVAGFVTFGLFWVMQALIGVEGKIDDKDKHRVVDFVRLRKDTDVDDPGRKKPDKKPPEEPPPPPDLNLAQNENPDQDVTGLDMNFESEVDIGTANAGVAATDSDTVPLVRVEPQYPERARQRGIEGWVQIEFTISAAGTVKSPRVVGYKPSTIFNRAALRAVRKWKYNPKIEDGEAVERPGVKIKLVFALDE